MYKNVLGRKLLQCRKAIILRCLMRDLCRTTVEMMHRLIHFTLFFGIFYIKGKLFWGKNTHSRKFRPDKFPSTCVCMHMFSSGGGIWLPSNALMNIWKQSGTRDRTLSCPSQKFVFATAAFLATISR